MREETKILNALKLFGNSASEVLLNLNNERKNVHLTRDELQSKLNDLEWLEVVTDEIVSAYNTIQLWMTSAHFTEDHSVFKFEKGNLRLEFTIDSEGTSLNVWLITNDWRFRTHYP